MTSLTPAGGLRSAYAARGVLLGLLLLTSGACSATRPTALPGIARDAAALEQASLEALLAGNLGESLLLEEEALRSWRRIDAASHVAAALNRTRSLRIRRS